MIPRPLQGPDIKVSLLPPPISGIYQTEEGEDSGGLSFAEDLVNVIPEEGLSVRRGYKPYANVGSPVRALYQHVNAIGDRVFLATAGGKVYDISNGGAGVSLTDSLGAFSSDKWGGVTLGVRSVFANGKDDPLLFDGVSFSHSNFTHSQLVQNKIYKLNTYKSRLYLIEDNSTRIYYGGVGATDGAVSLLDIGDQLRLGGKVIYAGSFTQDTGAGLTNLFVIVSSRGEILLYSGSFPASEDWRILGRFSVAEPVGEDAVFSIPADIAILTTSGISLLSSLINQNDVDSSSSELTAFISKPYREDVRAHRVTPGWFGVFYPKRNWIIVNVPLFSLESSKQWVAVMPPVISKKTPGRAWTRFTGLQSLCFGLFNSNIFFGTSSGAIYEFDKGYNDNQAGIPISIKYGYSDFGLAVLKKQIVAAKSSIKATSPIKISYLIETDFEKSITSGTTLNEEESLTTLWGSSWGSPWGRSQSFSYRTVWQMMTAPFFYRARLQIKTTLKNIKFKLNSTSIHYKAGGVF